MRKYDVVIIDQKEIEQRFGEMVKFDENGFLSYKNKIDFWNELEYLLCQPVVSIRPSGREGWDEVLILLAKGFTKGDKRVLDYDNESDIKTVLLDIFQECENDEYEVFEHYEGTCTKKVWKNVDTWVHETW